MDNPPSSSHEQHNRQAAGLVDGADANTVPFAAIGMGTRIGLFLLALFSGFSFGQFFLIFALGARIDNDLARTIVSMFGLWTGFALVLWWTSRKWGTGRPIRDFAGSLRRPLDIPLGIAAGLMGQLLLVPLLYIPIRWIAPDQVAKVSDVATDLVNLAPGAQFLLLILFVGLLAPAVEELVFRGFAYRLFDQKIGPWGAIAATSLVFGLFHFEGIQTPGLVLAGVLFGVLRWRTGRVLPAVAAHVAFNMTTLLVQYYG